MCERNRTSHLRGSKLCCFWHLRTCEFLQSLAFLYSHFWHLGPSHSTKLLDEICTELYRFVHGWRLGNIDSLMRHDSPHTLFDMRWDNWDTKDETSKLSTFSPKQFQEFKYYSLYNSLPSITFDNTFHKS